MKAILMALALLTVAGTVSAASSTSDPCAIAAQKYAAEELRKDPDFVHYNNEKNAAVITKITV